MGWLATRARAFRHAGRGIVVLLGEPHGRIHAGAAVLVVVLGLGLGVSGADWAKLAICIGMVLAAEAINSALERVVDLASPEWHALARDAKDLAAGAVLILAIAAAFVAVIVFLPYL